jgi:hypothetical protein
MPGELSVAELVAIRDALGYAKQRIQEYPHREYQHKLDSLRPIESATQKVRELLKEARK